MRTLAIYIVCLFCVAANAKVLNNKSISPVIIAGQKIVCPSQRTQADLEIRKETEFFKKIRFSERLETKDTTELYNELKALNRSDPNNYIAQVEMIRFRKAQYALPPGTPITFESVPYDDQLREALKVYKSHPFYYKVYYDLVLLNDEHLGKKSPSSLLDCAAFLNPAFHSQIELKKINFLAKRAGRIDEAVKKLATLDRTTADPLALADSASKIAEAAGDSKTLSRARVLEVLRQVEAWIDEALNRAPNNWRVIDLKTVYLEIALDFDMNKYADLALVNSKLRKLNSATFRPAANDLILARHRKDWVAAAKFAQEAIVKEGSFKPYFARQLAEFEMKLGHSEKAFDWAKESILSDIGEQTLKCESGRILKIFAFDGRTKEVLDFIYSLDKKYSDLKTIWECEIRVNSHAGNLRFRGEELLKQLPKCEKSYAKIGLKNSREEAYFLFTASASLDSMGFPKESKTLRQRWAKKDPDKMSPDLMVRNVMAFVQSEGDYEGALAYINRVGKNTPKGQLLLANYLFFRGETAEALKVAKAIDPKTLEPAFEYQLPDLLGSIYEKLGDPKKAFEAANERFLLNGDQDGLYEVAKQMLKLKGPKAALTYMESNNKPKMGRSPLLMAFWSDVLSTLGRKKESLEKQILGLEYDPFNQISLINLAVTYAKDLKDCGKAKPYIERAAEVAYDLETQGRLMDLMTMCGIPKLTMPDIR